MSSLHKKTRSLLIKDRRALTTISNESGLPYHWLHSFRYAKTENPSVNRVQRLYEHLTGDKLPLK
jgi:hypothetical protein